MISWIIFALLSAVFAALVAIVGKVGIQSIDPTLATTVRSVIMAGFLVVTALLLGKGKLLATIDTKALLFIALSGIAGALSWLAYFVALRTGPAPAVAALDRLSVVFVLIFAVLFLSDHLTWKTGVGAALITTGAILMTLR
ncbi:MAG: EamA family transporter [Candidatus Andersenbacteria bacterium]|nr:EamA family transporter [Candidatus Andersenbacteria bacterium]MBI3250852.1 EamA family transporter [Candidatus Andersenbacteria bacterium]